MGTKYTYILMTDHDKFTSDAMQIVQKYNGDFDTMPGLPDVTYTEMRLLQIIINLELRVNALERARVE